METGPGPWQQPATRSSLGPSGWHYRRDLPKATSAGQQAARQAVVGALLQVPEPVGEDLVLPGSTHSRLLEQKVCLQECPGRHGEAMWCPGDGELPPEKGKLSRSTQGGREAQGHTVCCCMLKDTLCACCSCSLGAFHQLFLPRAAFFLKKSTPGLPLFLFLENKEHPGFPPSWNNAHHTLLRSPSMTIFFILFSSPLSC